MAEDRNQPEEHQEQGAAEEETTFDIDVDDSLFSEAVATSDEDVERDTLTAARLSKMRRSYR